MNRGKVGPRCARHGAGAPAPHPVQGFTARNWVSENSFHEPLSVDLSHAILPPEGGGTAGWLRTASNSE
jgi:hypothetical protein